MQLDKTTNRFLAFTIIFFGPLTAPVANSAPAPGNISGAEFPHIDAELRVTFRFKAPEAKKVQLRGGAGLVKDALELARGENDFWTGTTPPATPGFHYYWFVVDGVNVNDPASYSYFGYGRECSGVEVPDQEGGFYAARHVPQGEDRA